MESFSPEIKANEDNFVSFERPKTSRKKASPSPAEYVDYIQPSPNKTISNPSQKEAIKVIQFDDSISTSDEADNRILAEDRERLACWLFAAALNI